MGVSASGKTTLGKLLAQQLGLPFYDADNFHPIQNIQKMQEGKPLGEEDRKPWLEKLSEEIKQWDRDGGAVLACSALKESYRDILSSNVGNIQWIYLEADRDTLITRLKNRKGHFFNPLLLDSQLEALEVPFDAIKVSVRKSPQECC